MEKEISIFKIVMLLLCVHVCFDNMFVCVSRLCTTNGSQKRVLDSLGQELQTVSRWFVGQDGLWKSNPAHLEEQPKLITIFPAPVFVSCKL